MTIEELYKWAVDNKAKDYDIIARDNHTRSGYSLVDEYDIVIIDEDSESSTIRKGVYII